jgi:hypothetical protein
MWSTQTEKGQQGKFPKTTQKIKVSSLWRRCKLHRMIQDSCIQKDGTKGNGTKHGPCYKVSLLLRGSQIQGISRQWFSNHRNYGNNCITEDEVTTCAHSFLKYFKVTTEKHWTWSCLFFPHFIRLWLHP